MTLQVHPLFGTGAGDGGGYVPLTWTFTVVDPYENYTGHTGTQTFGLGENPSGGLVDFVFVGASSVAAVDVGGSGHITADLGSPAEIALLYLAPIPNTFDGWGWFYLDQTVVQHSTNGTDWTTVITLDLSTYANNDPAEYVSVAFEPVATARYVRLLPAGTNYLGVGEFIVLSPYDPT